MNGGAHERGSHIELMAFTYSERTDHVSDDLEGLLPDTAAEENENGHPFSFFE
jgi:hypothetical protein